MLWLVVAGCVEPTTGSFLGELGATDARIGVAVDEAEVTVYFAGGEETLATHTRWFTSPRSEEDTFAATSDDGWELSGRVEDGAVFGDLIDPEGILTPWNVNAPIDPASGDGLWSGPTDAGACRPGVILYNSAFNVQGGYCPAEGEIVPVSGVDLSTADGVIQLNANAPTGMIPFEATPVVPFDEE